MLAKGPVALALVAVPVLLAQLLDRRLWPATLGRWSYYLGVTALVAAPWYVAFALDDWPAFVTFFWLHNVLRFVEPFDHAKPWWFYLPSLLLGTLPWSLLLLPLGWFLTRRGAKMAARRTPALGFFLLAFLWSVSFFSLAGCKRAVYILPALPLLALVLALALRAALPWRERWGLALPLVAAPWARRRAAAPLGWLVCAVVLFALLTASICELLPSYNRRFALRGQIRRHEAMCASQALPVLCYPRRWDSVSFYLPNARVQAYTPAELARMCAEMARHVETLAVIKAGKHFDVWLQALPRELEFVPQGPQRGSVHVGIVKRRTAVAALAHGGS